MTFIFYDTETTGLEPAFDQILQFAAIVTDDNFNTIEELNLRGRLQPHVIASPGAVAITNVGPRAIQSAPLSFYQMVCAIRRLIEKSSPAVLIGFNSISFDEDMLRQAFYQTLHPTFLTNTNGNSRMDVLRLSHAVAEHAPHALTVPLSEKGALTFRLGALIDANGLSLNNAHDALADTRATVALAKRLRALAPDVWNYLYECRSRQSATALLNAHDPILFTDRSFRKPTILGGRIAASVDNPAYIALFDLAYDPALYLDVDNDRALRLLKSSPRPIRVVRTNALPILQPYRTGVDVGVDLAVAQERLRQIKTHSGFAEVIARALAGQHGAREPSQYVEEHIYEGFPSSPDSRLMTAFHKAAWEERPAIAARFEDGRYQELAERIIFAEAPDVFPADRRATMAEWRRDRLQSADTVPWLTIAKAKVELAALRAKTPPPSEELARDIESYLSSLEAST